MQVITVFFLIQSKYNVYINKIFIIDDLYSITLV